MWTASPAAVAWHEAMARQAEHSKISWSSCRLDVPRCEMGRRLQGEARAAHEAWVSEQYAGKAVA